jgi:predicted N-acyltransferase
MPEETYSAHYIVHPGLNRAVENYLERERAAIQDEIDELAAQGPFKKL